MYADELTEAMEKAISETNRRRSLQINYNKEHGIVPKTITKSIREDIQATIWEDVSGQLNIDKDKSIKEVIDELTEQMMHYASEMEFEKAAEIRDKIKELEGFI